MADADERGRTGQMRTERDQRPERAGRLLVIGGAEDPDEDEMTILPHLVKMAGGKDARIVICSTPSENPEEKVDVYRALFEKIMRQKGYLPPLPEDAAAP